MEQGKEIYNVGKCPNCGHKGRVAEEAYKVAEMEIPTGGFPSLEKTFVPLEEPRLAGVTVRVLVNHYDVCTKCGTRYGVKGEVVKAPVQAQQIPGRKV